MTKFITLKSNSTANTHFISYSIPSKYHLSPRSWAKMAGAPNNQEKVEETTGEADTHLNLAARAEQEQVVEAKGMARTTTALEVQEPAARNGRATPDTSSQTQASSQSRGTARTTTAREVH
jgi:hypothetical protein